VDLFGGDPIVCKDDGFARGLLEELLQDLDQLLQFGMDRVLYLSLEEQLVESSVLLGLEEFGLEFGGEFECQGLGVVV